MLKSSLIESGRKKKQSKWISWFIPFLCWCHPRLAITLNLNIYRKLFGSCFFAGTIKPCDYGQVYSKKQCVGKFFDFEFCLDHILLESTWVQKVCQVLGVNYNVGAPSIRIHGLANATHTQFQLSTRICKSVGFKRNYSRVMQFRGRDSQVSCERRRVHVNESIN